MPISITEIREAIRDVGYTRESLTGGTSEEFKRQGVGPKLTEKVAQLRALEISPRFEADIQRRAKEIWRCEQVINRWNSVQDSPKTCPHGLGFNCRECWPQAKP
jgi:hypothetical protein